MTSGAKKSKVKAVLSSRFSAESGVLFAPYVKMPIFHYGTWDDPECSVYGKLPEKLAMAEEYECPDFIHDKKSNDNIFFTLDENGKPLPKRK